MLAFARGPLQILARRGRRSAAGRTGVECLSIAFNKLVLMMYPNPSKNAIQETSTGPDVSFYDPRNGLTR